MHAETLRAGSNSAFATLKNVAGAIAGAAMVALLIRLLLDLATKLHVVLGAVLAAAVAAGAVWLIRYVKNSKHATDAAGVFAVLSLGLLTFAVAGAWLSYTLHIKDLAGYAVPPAFSPGTFVDLYMYTFLDLLPAIDVWDTLKVEPPIEPLDSKAGLPLLCFKVFVVWLLFDAFRAWLERRHDATIAATGAQAV